MLRRFAPPLVALAAFACQPSVPKNPPVVDYAAFDPTAGVFPVPNALLLQFAATVPGAQGELLQAFARQNGFPYDQVLPVSIDLVREDLSEPTAPSRSAPPLDLASIVPCTAQTSPGSCNLLVLDALDGQYARVRASYAAGASAGTLSLTRIDAAALDPAAAPPIPWRPGGNYFVALRGGPGGVKTTGGGQLNASSTMYAILFSARDELPSPEAQFLQDSYQPVFAAVENRGFPKADIAVVATFPIAPASTWVKADPTTGDMPLPSDFLFDLSTGHVSALLEPLIPGISTLDGFSTTGMVLAETSGPVEAATIRTPAARGVYLYDLTIAASPALVHDVVDYLLNPATSPAYAAVTSPPVVDPATGLANVIGLQPAVGVGTPAPPGSTPTQISLPPLKERTRYAVVVTNGVLDAGGVALSRTTLGTILLLSNPICLPAGCDDPAGAVFPGISTLAGVSPADAAGLESQRLALQPVLAALETPLGCDTAPDPLACVKDQVAFAWTFRTQTVTGDTAQLPMLPFAGGAFGIKPGPVTALATADAFKKHGVDPAVVSSGNIAEVLETTIPIVNLLDPYTGAFLPDSGDWRLKQIPATVVVPTPAALASAPDCPGVPGLKCAPLVVFHHGLTRGRADMLLVADALAGKGFVVAAIDGPLHGDRSYCTQDSDCVRDDLTAGTCTPVAPPATPQGDESPPPGACTAGTLAKDPALCATAQCFLDFAAVLPSQRGGIATTSGFYALHPLPPATPNLYRTRDSIRQDLVDVSSLALALARPPPEAEPFLPAFPPGAESPVAVHLAGKAPPIYVNPGAVYYEGQSLGALLGTLHAATQPQLSRVVLNVGGGSIADIFTQSPAFAPGPPAPPPLSAETLRLVHVFKWILDPAEPLNFAGTARLRVAGGGFSILGQWAACDQVVPNTASALLYDNLGLRPSSPTASTSVLYANSTRSGAACILGVEPNPGTLGHGFLADWGLGTGALDPNDLALTLLGQDDAATFLFDLTLPPPVQRLPVPYP